MTQQAQQDIVQALVNHVVHTAQAADPAAQVPEVPAIPTEATHLVVPVQEADQLVVPPAALAVLAGVDHTAHVAVVHHEVPAEAVLTALIAVVHPEAPDPAVHTTHIVIVHHQAEAAEEEADIITGDTVVTGVRGIHLLGMA